VQATGASFEITQVDEQVTQDGMERSATAYAGEDLAQLGV